MSEEGTWTPKELLDMIQARINSWKSHRIAHGEDSLLMHRLDARIDELNEVLRWIMDRTE